MILRRSLQLGWPLIALVTGCSSAETSLPTGSDEAPLEDSGAAAALLEQIRAKIGAPTDTRSASLVASRLTNNPGVAFRRAGRVLKATIANTDRPESAVVTLPVDASSAFRVAVPGSALWVDARLEGARAVPAQAADGLVVYPSAGPEDGTLIQRVGADGTEDWLTLARHPKGGRVVYAIDVSAEVRGLRLVENTLEFLDGASTPRLRVDPPYLVDANGKEHSARLDVEGCAVDRDASAPWDREIPAPGAATCAVVVSWDASGVAYPAVLDPSWTSTANMSTARARHTATLLGTGRVLVAGGQNGSSALSSATLYDPVSRTWASTGSMSTSRVLHTATLRQSGGTVVVVGGWNLSSTHRSAESYNPSSGTWSSLPQPISARRQHTATLLGNGQILVAGGSSGSSTVLSSTETLSTTNSWSAAGNLLSAQTGHTATLYAADRVLVTGFTAPTSQRYDANTRTWTATAGTATGTRPTSVARQLHTATLLADGGVLLAGGTNNVLSAERYDAATDAFTWVGATNFAHSAHTAHLLPNNRVLVAGGPTTDARSGSEVFNPTWGTWSPAPLGARIIRPRSAHASVLVGGQVLVTGGLLAGTNTTTNTAELYNPAGGDVTVAEYELPRHRDTEVLVDRDIELWASLHRPATLTAGTRYPLVMMTHGAYFTCRNDANGGRNNDYANTGSCNTAGGFTRIRNHRGYDYLAEELAARGYFVVSVNMNYGINNDTIIPDDVSGIRARGRLLLRHIEKLSRWDRGLEATPASLGVSLQNRVDFSQVGLFGHSRGGEASRLAYNEFRKAGSVWPGRINTPTAALAIRGIFEIGPTDARTPPEEADGTRWAVLLPGCDGDNFADGIKPFNRTFALPETTAEFKASFQIYGMNHNNYNTQWWTGDPSPAGCVNHQPISIDSPTQSPRQRQSGVFPVVSFFTANVGATRDTIANRVFDPAFPLAADYRVHRGYHPGASTTLNLTLDDMVAGTLSHQAGPGANLFYQPLTGNFQMVRVELTSPGTSTFFQSNFGPASGVNLNAYQNLDFRIDRLASFTDPITAGTFSVQLVNANGTLSSAVASGPYVDLAPPPRMSNVLQTARIPLTAFSGANRSAIRGVRFVFADPTVAGVFIANIRATRTTTP